MINWMDQKGSFSHEAISNSQDTFLSVSWLDLKNELFLMKSYDLIELLSIWFLVSSQLETFLRRSLHSFSVAVWVATKFLGRIFSVSSLKDRDYNTFHNMDLQTDVNSGNSKLGTSANIWEKMRRNSRLPTNYSNTNWRLIRKFYFVTVWSQKIHTISLHSNMHNIALSLSFHIVFKSNRMKICGIKKIKRSWWEPVDK